MNESKGRINEQQTALRVTEGKFSYEVTVTCLNIHGESNAYKPKSSSIREEKYEVK